MRKLLRDCLLFSLILMLNMPLQANYTNLLVEHDTIPHNDVLAYQKQLAQLDSLYLEWLNRQLPVFSVTDSSYVALKDGLTPSSPDSVYAHRLSQIPSAVDLTYNPRVKSFIDLYVLKRRNQVELMLGLATHYLPIFEEILDAQDLPLELKYMPVIESALNPRARSRVGASGLWQFMYGTAKGYDLKISSFVDERMDPVKSSRAAAMYLKDLYAIYNDWHLVIAAYNCGPGNVNKAIRRSGGKRNYWDIYYHLPRETRGYVPAFIAATYIMNFSYEHMLNPLPLEFPRMLDTVNIKEELHLGQVSDVLGIPLNQLQALNPQYRRSIIPGVGGPYSLVLPADMMGSFISMEDSISNYNDKIYFSKANLGKSPSRSKYTPEIPKGDYHAITYKVKEGDNLGYIADWYGVGLTNLRYWNNIYGNLINVGKTLTVYVPGSKLDKLKQVDKMSFAQKQEMIGRPAQSGSNSSATVNKTILASDDYHYYKVRSGDNLWDIARKYPGISNNDIMRLNGMKTSALKVGQMLKIKPKEG